MENLKLHMLISVESEEKREQLVSTIHNQLKNNDDYMNGNIELWSNSKTHEINIRVYKECENIPSITIE